VKGAQSYEPIYLIAAHTGPEEETRKDPKEQTLLLTKPIENQAQDGPPDSNVGSGLA